MFTPVAPETMRPVHRLETDFDLQGALVRENLICRAYSGTRWRD
jgi:hypothetical protein